MDAIRELADEKGANNFRRSRQDSQIDWIAVQNDMKEISLMFLIGKCFS